VFDCAVVGGGPAGSAAAMHLAAAGARVVLLDREAFPRKKPCGEGILPAGVDALRALGLLDAAARLGSWFRGVRYTGRGGAAASGDFPDGRGLAVPRELLDELLVRAAAARGVSVRERSLVASAETGLDSVVLRGADGRELARARRLVAADGLRSPVLRALGVARRAPARARFGLAARVSGFLGLEDRVEVFLVDGGEAYVTPLGNGTASVALLLEPGGRRRLADGRERGFRALLAGCPGLRDRAAGARLMGPIAGLGPLAGRAERVEGPLWRAAGDAAGAVDPLVGDGIGLALRGGELAARSILDSLAGRGQPGDYSAARAGMTRRKRALAAAVLALSRSPVLARPALAFLARAPAAFAALLAD
jgi:flavin-dependent dehydrogenase